MNKAKKSQRITEVNKTATKAISARYLILTPAKHISKIAITNTLKTDNSKIDFFVLSVFLLVILTGKQAIPQTDGKESMPMVEVR